MKKPAMTHQAAGKLARSIQARGYCRTRLVYRLRSPSSPQDQADFLELVSVKIRPAEIAKWSPLMSAMAEEYAAMVHLSASDNPYIRIPPRPNFFPRP